MDADYIITEINSKKMGWLLENGNLVRARFLDSGSLIGNVYIAKVMNIVPSINAAFLDAGTGDTIYYSLSDNEGKHIFTRHGKSKKVCIGDELLVQIVKDPIKSKKGVADSNISIKGDYTILDRSGNVGISRKIDDGNQRNRLKAAVEKCLAGYKTQLAELPDFVNSILCSAGAIIRTSAVDADSEDIEKDIMSLLGKFREIAEKAEHAKCKSCIYIDKNDSYREIEDFIKKNKYETFRIITDIRSMYDDLCSRLILSDTKNSVKYYEDENLPLIKLYNVEHKLEKGFNKYIYLKSGGSIVVEPTEAMTVIDVNTGKAIKGKDVQKTFLKINKEAATEIARVIRLRNLSGIIMIDFISMKEPGDIKELIEHLKLELDKDEIRTTFVDITSLGLVELTRKKQEKPINYLDFVG